MLPAMTIEVTPTETTRHATMSQSTKPRAACSGGGSGAGGEIDCGETGGASGSSEGSGRAVFPSIIIQILD